MKKFVIFLLSVIALVILAMCVVLVMECNSRYNVDYEKCYDPCIIFYSRNMKEVGFSVQEIADMHPAKVCKRFCNKSIIETYRGYIK